MSSLPSMATAPVLIVGAGPAGASLALQLAEAGVPVTLVEASRDFSRQFRGEALMPSGQEALAAMGLEPLLEGLSRRPLDGWSVWIEGRHLFTAEEPLGSQRPCTLVAQAPLLEALVRRARMAPGFTWLPGVAVADLLWENGRARGVRLVDGRCLPACLVVGADGRRSVVRQRAGLRGGSLVGFASSKGGTHALRHVRQHSWQRALRRRLDGRVALPRHERRR